MFLTNLFHAIIGIFKSDKAKHDFEVVAALVPKVLPIITTIATLTPTRTDDEIVNAFSHFGVPFLAVGVTDPGAALLQLATTVVAEKVAPGTAKNIIQSAISLAVTGMKADKG